MYETAKEYLSDTDCILDISSTLMFLDKKTAESYANHYGAERLAFGTDYPVWDPVQEVQRFLSQPFAVAEQFTGFEGKYVPLKETVRGFQEIIEGKHDAIPESCFLFAGSIDDVVAKWKGQMA